MPALDLSPWIAGRLRDGDSAAIDELLEYLSYPTHAQAVRKTMANFNLNRFIRGEDALLNELWAIYFLIYRYSESGHESNRILLLRELLTHSLASWPFELVDESLPHMLQGANAYIRKRNREMKDVRLPEALLDSEYLANLKVAQVSQVGEELRRFPVTFRAAISYSIERGSPDIGCIRPQLSGHYGLRQFGLSAELNRRDFTSAAFFSAPDDIM